MPIYRLIYSSANCVSANDKPLLQQLREILAVSRRNNERDGITGFLMFEPDWFLQILEGEHDKVQATYDRIGRDRRHGSVKLLEAKSVPSRGFEGWSMGGAMRTPEVEGIYLSHGISGALKPTMLKAGQVLALALDLNAHETKVRNAYRPPAA
jgi:hypothetical protein